MSFSCLIDGARTSKKNCICAHCFNLEIRGYITKNFEKKKFEKYQDLETRVDTQCTLSIVRKLDNGV